MNESAVKTVARGTMWLSVSTILLKCIGLVTVFIILSRLSVYEYGLIELTLSAISFFSIILVTGIYDIIVSDLSVELGQGNTYRMKAIFKAFSKCSSY